MPLLCLCHEVRQGEIGIRPCYEVGMVVVQQLFLHPFRHAAKNPDDEVRSLWLSFLSDGIELLQPMVDFLFRIVAHGTGVEEDGIGLLDTLAGVVACHLHDRGYHLRVGYVHLAAVGFYIQFLHLSFILAPHYSL